MTLESTCPRSLRVFRPETRLRASHLPGAESTAVRAVSSVQELSDRVIAASLAPWRTVPTLSAEIFPELVPGPCAQELVTVGTDSPQALPLTAGWHSSVHAVEESRLRRGRIQRHGASHNGVTRCAKCSSFTP